MHTGRDVALARRGSGAGPARAAIANGAHATGRLAGGPRLRAVTPVLLRGGGLRLAVCRYFGASSSELRAGTSIVPPVTGASVSRSV